MPKEETICKRPLVCGLVAHVDAGKTTLSEAMLYVSGTRRVLGRVDHRDAFLDSSDLERQRGITIFSKQARLETAHRALTLWISPRRRSGCCPFWTAPCWSSAVPTGSRPTP